MNVEPRELMQEVDPIEAWLFQGKAVVESAVRRVAVIHDCCPSVCRDDDRPPLLKKLAVLNADITVQLQSLRTLELEHNIGCSQLDKKLLDEDCLYLATMLLFFARLNDSLHFDLRRISLLAQAAAGTCPVQTLRVRSAFRSNGELYPWVRLEDLEWTIDQASAALSEVALCKIQVQPHSPMEAALVAMNSNGLSNRRRRG